MTIPIDNRLDRAQDLLRTAREEFARAEEAKGGAAVIGLRNSCGKGWLAALDAVNAFFMRAGVPEAELPTNDRGRTFFARRHMDRNMRRAFGEMRNTFHIDGYYQGIVEFDDMPKYLDELEEFIESIAQFGGS
jgi:hypothetical protein